MYYIVETVEGEKSGFETKLGSITGIKYLISNHFIAHRLNLALKLD